MSIKILTKEYNGNNHYYVSVVENNRVKSKVVQTVKAYIVSVNGEQITY